MDNIQIFENPEFGNVRTLEDANGEVLFCGTDIAKALGYSNPSKAISDHCKQGGITKRYTPTTSGEQLMPYITEGNVYRLIARSKLPEAEKFEHWVFDEVLPSIRKHGAYMTDDVLHKAITEPDFLIKLATELKEEQEKRKKLETKVEQDKPLVLFADSVQTSHTSILIGDLAKILKQNGVDIGQKRLFGWMREQGFLMKGGASKNMPSQYSMERGLMEIKESTVNMPDGSIRVTKTTKVTGKGQIYFVNKFLGEN